MRYAGLVFLLLFATAASGQGFPPSKRVEHWRSPKNRARLTIDWEVVPAHAPVELPDGKKEPAAAPWPMLLIISTEQGNAHRKMEEGLFRDTQFRLASRACRAIVVKPAAAARLPFLRDVFGLKDPTLVVLSRKFKPLGVLRSRGDFTPKTVLALMGKAVDPAYRIGLADYLRRYDRIMQKEEKLRREEVAIDLLEERAVGRDGNKQKTMLAEAKKRRAALDAARLALENEEADLKGALVPKTTEALPTRTGKGGKGRALTPEESAALKTYREYARDKNPHVRAAAVEDLGAVDSGFMAEVVLKAARDKDKRVVEAAGRALGRMGSAKALEAMHAALADSNPRVRTAALLGLAYGERDYPAAAQALRERLQDKDVDVRRAALRAIAVQKDGAAPLIEALEDAEPALRVIAANLLGKRRDKEAAAALAGCLDNTDWSLRKAAAEALGRIRVKESIAPLLDRFGKEQGVMREVIYKALVAITAQDFRYDVGNWQRWWERYAKSFRVPSAGEVAQARQRAAKALSGYAKPDKRKYHRIETLSQRMVFVIDISASMDEKVVPPLVPGKLPPPRRKKIEIARTELITLLATLDERCFFNIVTFAGEAKPWKDRLQRATGRNAAIKYVAKLKPMQAGGRRGSRTAQLTNTYAALLTAFGIAEEKARNWRSRTKADTIFLLTDGAPTAGTLVEPRKIIDAITAINESRGVAIHVICFSKPTARILRPLADRNGGKLVIVSD